MILAAVDLTVTWVSVQHLLDDEQLLIPVGLPPAISVGLGGAVGDLLQTPLAVIPYPIYLRVLLEEGGGQG